MPESRSFVPPFARRTLGALHAPPPDDRSLPGAPEADADDEADGDGEAGEDTYLDDGPATGGREGLPHTYRMRHEPHYVETLGRPAAAPRDPVPVAADLPMPTPTALVAIAPALDDALEAIGDALNLLPEHARSLRERVALAFARAELARARWLTAAATALEIEPLPALDQVQLGDVMTGVADALDHERRLTGDGPEMDLPADPQPVFGDERLLVVSLGAAITAMRAIGDARGTRGRVTVRVAPRQETATRVLEIAQSGLRLPPEAYTRFFDRGWAAHPAGAAGVMLLAAARRIANAHGGSLTVEALGTGGCRLLLQIPAA